jgi:antitoxin HigA-1
MSTRNQQVKPLEKRTRRPVHPGAVLREDVLPSLGITQGEFARKLGVSRKTINEVLTERRPISADLAHRLGRLLGNGPGLWLRMQQQVDLWDALHLDSRPYQSIQPLEHAA